MKFHVRERGRDQGRYDHSRPLGPTTHSFLRRRIVKSANQAGFLPDGPTPSVDGRPSVSRRWATEAFPKSGRLSNASSDISRTSPTVWRPAATNTLRILDGNSTSLISVSSGSSGVGSSI